MLSQACCRQCKLNGAKPESEPIGQDREGLIARMTDSAAHPNVFVVFVVGLAEPAVHGRRSRCGRGRPDIAAAGGPAGSPRVDALSFASGSAIKIITAGVKARR